IHFKKNARRQLTCLRGIWFVLDCRIRARLLLKRCCNFIASPLGCSCSACKYGPKSQVARLLMSSDQLKHYVAG
ncbi:hypothetical protein M758_2G014200, partial [Ceratodon purpureus]